MDDPSCNSPSCSAAKFWNQLKGRVAYLISFVKLQSNNKGIGMTKLYAAWFVATIATAGSLFFSEVMKLPPCVLCWYQRIAMYPLVWILAVGIVRKNTDTKLLALPVALTGLAISIYHNLLYYKWIPESITPCTSGVSCTSRQLEWFGFVTIPLLSLCAFLLIFILLSTFKKEDFK
jgi:disulfide bond formation protein DsbB